MSPEDIVELVRSGPFILAFALSIAAGLVSFFSPCVLPLLPGYLSYMTGLGAADLAGARRGRMLLGSSLFVLGFTVVFVSLGSIVGSIGLRLNDYQGTINVVMGSVLIVLGFAFMGMVPFLQRDVRVHKVPAVGVAFAPLLGALFAIGWTPCIGPTLAGVLSLSLTPGATATRGALLTLAYCIGLGVPFIGAALGFARFMRLAAWVRAHQRGISLAGGSVLVVVGVLLVTGLWADIVLRMQGSIVGFETVI